MTQMYVPAFRFSTNPALRLARLSSLARPAGQGLLLAALLLFLAGTAQAAYTRILALTFTNKAAGEMRERIMKYLEGLAGTGELTIALADVRDALVEVGGVPATTVRERAGKMLTHILHHWPHFAVSTIDAFTRRVVMPFARCPATRTCAAR